MKVSQIVTRAIAATHCLRRVQIPVEVIELIIVSCTEKVQGCNLTALQAHAFKTEYAIYNNFICAECDAVCTPLVCDECAKTICEYCCYRTLDRNNYLFLYLCKKCLGDRKHMPYEQ